VVICSQPPDNSNKSVTNMAEYLAAEEESGADQPVKCYEASTRGWGAVVPGPPASLARGTARSKQLLCEDQGGRNGTPSHPRSARLTRRVPVRLRLKGSSLATREILGPRSWRRSGV
jgi:hypothetical protein